MLLVNRLFVPDETFQPNIIFATRLLSALKVHACKYCTKLKVLPRTNTLDYLFGASVMKKKMFLNIDGSGSAMTRGPSTAEVMLNLRIGVTSAATTLLTW
jgi:hypothetical protein